MSNTSGLTRRTLAAVGLAVAALSPIPFQGPRAASGDAPAAPEGPLAENFTFSDPPVPAPSLAFRTLDGNSVSLADFKGRVVLVNFWATWCGPCVQEMPSLERLHEALADEGLAIVAVSQDRGGASVVNPFLSRLDLQFLPVYLDPKGSLGRAFAVKALPTSFLIDRDGKVVAGLLGPTRWDSPETKALIRRYLRQQGTITNTSG